LPSVILISIDTLRADRMSVYGYERPTTPRLEEIAEGLETRLRTIRASDTRVLG
jgi:glucan phosphoethanolaminetransferase (alkaline phosphatase superfamily)